MMISEEGIETMYSEILIKMDSLLGLHRHKIN